MRPDTPLPRLRVTALAAAALLLSAGLAACSKDGGGDAPDGASIAGMLSVVPDTEGNRQYVVVNRYAAAEEGADISAKGDDDDERQMDRFLQLSKQAGITPTGVVDTTMGVDRIGQLGFDPSDVVATVSAGNPPDTTDVAVVDADEDDVLEAAGEVEGSERTEVDGVDVVRWLDDHEVSQGLETPFGRVPGQAGRVGFVDDGVLVTSTSDDVEAAAIATAKGDEESLMDVDGIAAVANALDDEDAFTAFIAGVALEPDDSRLTPEQRKQQEEDDDTPSLQDYTALGLGNRWGDDGLELVIAIAHDDEAAAKADAEALEAAVKGGTSGQTAEPLSTYLDDPDIERDGTTVVGTFEIERPDLWYQFVARMEPFLFGR